MSNLNDPKYLIAPGMVNLTAWRRDNTNWGPPKFKVGDCVRLTQPLYIIAVGNDCDGEPLFAASLEDPKTLTPDELAHPDEWVLRVSNLSAHSFESAEASK